MQRTVLRLAIDKLSEPIPEPTRKTPRPDPATAALARERSLRRRLTHQARADSWARTRARVRDRTVTQDEPPQPIDPRPT